MYQHQIGVTPAYYVKHRLLGGGFTPEPRLLLGSFVPRPPPTNLIMRSCKFSVFLVTEIMSASISNYCFDYRRRD